MTIELKYLVWTLILAIAQIAITATLRTMETGLPYNAGPRDMPSPAAMRKITGRFSRAERNLFETLPIYIALILVAHAAQIHNGSTQLGAALYFWARVAYVPLYALGIPYARTVAWTVGLFGIITLIGSVL